MSSTRTRALAVAAAVAGLGLIGSGAAIASTDAPRDCSDRESINVATCVDVLHTIDLDLPVLNDADVDLPVLN